MFDETFRTALDRVGTGATHGFTAGHVSGDIGFVQPGEAHFRDRHHLRFARRADQRHGGNHLVGASGQTTEHGGGIGCVTWLAEDFVIQHHFGIAAQHHRARHGHDLEQAGTGLLAGHAAHVILRRFAGLAMLGDIQFKNAEVHAQAGEQFGPAGRLGGKMQHC